MAKVFFSLLLILFSACSGPRYVDYFPYHDDGKEKPKVVIIPVQDSSETNLPWDITKQITDQIYYQEMDSGELYFYHPDSISKSLADSPISVFDSDEILAKQFSGADFIVLTELMEHTLLPGHHALTPKNQFHCSPTLRLKLRLRILDVRRPCEPRTVLQEVIVDQVYVASPYISEGQPYETSAVCAAHQTFVRNLIFRIEAIIRSAY